MTTRQALYKARKSGYTTVKSDGTWYISKPYSSISYIIEIDNMAHYGIRNPEGLDHYIKAEEAEL